VGGVIPQNNTFIRSCASFWVLIFITTLAIPVNRTITPILKIFAILVSPSNKARFPRRKILKKFLNVNFFMCGNPLFWQGQEGGT